ncbi:IMP dehydrogenase [Actinocorallia populi]
MSGDVSGARPKFLPGIGLTFDDVLIVPAASQVIPSGVDTTTRLSRNITLAIPVVSAAMDTTAPSRSAR